MPGPSITQRLLAARTLGTINQGIQRGDLATGRGFDYPPEYYGNRGRGYTGPTGSGEVPYSTLPPEASGVMPGPAYSDLPLSMGSPLHPFDVQSAGPISPEVITSLADLSGPSVGQNIPPNEDVMPGLNNQWWKEPYDPQTGLYGGKPNPTIPYPSPGGPGVGDWALNAQKPVYPGPGYTNPAMAGQWAQGLADWQAGGWAPNVSDPEAGMGQDADLRAMLNQKRLAAGKPTFMGGGGKGAAGVNPVRFQ